MVAFEFHRPVVFPSERMAGAGSLCKSDLDDALRERGFLRNMKSQRSWARALYWSCIHAETVSGWYAIVPYRIVLVLDVGWVRRFSGAEASSEIPFFQ